MMSAFISYSHRDRPLAMRLSRVLTYFKLDHWWDDKIELSSHWNPALEDQLSLATSIVVLWSPNSCDSDWVQREATIGLDTSKLIQLRFSDAVIPPLFAERQAAEIPFWEENTYPRGIRLVLNEIARRQLKSEVIQDHAYLIGLKMSNEKVNKFMNEKKHYEGYFQKLDDTLFADVCDMLISKNLKLYDELRPGSRNTINEERYYELLQYLSDRSG